MSYNNSPENALRDSELSLVDRLQCCDPSALTELHQRYSRLIYTVIFRIVSDNTVAEDLAQEAFLSLWTHIRLFDARRGAVGPWLTRIARNRALDYLRSSDCRRLNHTCSLHEPFALQLFVLPENFVHALHQRKTLTVALRTLTRQERNLIHLAYLEGYSQSEIAARLGHPLGTVKTRTRAALNTLRAALQDASQAETHETARATSLSSFAPKVVNTVIRGPCRYRQPSLDSR